MYIFVHAVSIDLSASKKFYSFLGASELSYSMRGGCYPMLAQVGDKSQRWVVKKHEDTMHALS